MLSIPVPFIVSMLLGILAVTLYVRFLAQAKFMCVFLGLCALTTAMVGLRWTFNYHIFSILQPILASTIPVIAWLIFSHSIASRRFRIVKHFIGPLLVTACALVQPWLALPLDEVLTFIYIGYGIALIRYAHKDALLFNVVLGSWESVKKAESIAGWMLIFSALIDVFIALDFAFNQGHLALYILTAAHFILLPVLSIAVVFAGLNTPLVDDETSNLEPRSKTEADNAKAMTSEQARNITAKLDDKIRLESLYLDPELTLAKLTRKLGVPAKQISIAVNQVHQKNISRLINEYRIEHVKHALVATNDTVTQIFMNSGFQTKSNFNREFSRLTGMTPSEFRKINS